MSTSVVGEIYQPQFWIVSGSSSEVVSRLVNNWRYHYKASARRCISQGLRLQRYKRHFKYFSEHPQHIAVSCYHWHAFGDLNH